MIARWTLTLALALAAAGAVLGDEASEGRAGEGLDLSLCGPCKGGGRAWFDRSGFLHARWNKFFPVAVDCTARRGDAAWHPLLESGVTLLLCERKLSEEELEDCWSNGVRVAYAKGIACSTNDAKAVLGNFGGAVPVRAHLAADVWRSVADGAKGVRMNAAEARSPEGAQLIADVRKLGWALMSEEPPAKVAGAPAQLRVRTWKSGVDSYLLAVNVGSSPVRASLKLSAKFDVGQMKAGAGLALTGGDAVEAALGPNGFGVLLLTERVPKLFYAGDSLMADASKLGRGSWGEMLIPRLANGFTRVNLAQGGLSTRTYRNGGYWHNLLRCGKRDDWVIVSFGHNDTSGPDRGVLLPQFKANLGRFVDEARAEGLKPLFVSSVSGCTFNRDGSYRDHEKLTKYMTAVKELSSERDVPLVDLRAATQAMLKELGAEKARALYMVSQDGKDTTHTNPEGARRVADCFVREAAKLNLPFLGAAEGAVKFANGDFEQYDAKGRPVGWGLGRQMKAGRGFGHNANGGLVWESATPQADRLCSARQRVDGFVPGDCFTMSALMRRDGFRKGSGDGCAIVIEWYDDRDKWICAPGARGKADAKDGDWILCTGGGLVPERAVYGVLHIYVCSGSSGKLSFDNVTVAKVNREPVLFVCSSAYRDVAVDGNVGFHAVLNAARRAGKTEAFYRWRNAAGAETRRAARVSADGVASVELDVGELAEGTAPVVCELWEDGKKSGEGRLDFTRAKTLPKRRVWIDAHKRCIVDGKPFFPLGMYWGQSTDAMLGIYTNGAFNCVMPYQPMTRKILDKLQEYGIRTFSCVNQLSIGKEELLRRIEEQRDHPALLGWYVMDEAGVEKVPALTDWYRFVRAHDPDHPAYAVQDRIYDLREFMPATDVFGLDPYPVADHPLRRVTEFTRGGEQAVLGTRAFWNVPQTFAWRWYRPDMKERGRFPTLEEIRSMSWQHIAGGANGLVSFCFYRIVEAAKEPDPEVRKANFASVCAVSREIAKMFPVLLSVEPCPAVKPVDAKTAVCRAWAKGGELYVLACSLRDAAGEAEVEIASGAWCLAGTEVGTPATMTGGRRLKFAFAPNGVSFVRLSAVAQ